jgi:hypothetical protein
MPPRPRFNDIPEHLRKLADAVPGLDTPIWYAGTVYGETAQYIEDSMTARDAQGYAATENGNGNGRGPHTSDSEADHSQAVASGEKPAQEASPAESEGGEG